jgi:hypothetical protein
MMNLIACGGSSPPDNSEDGGTGYDDIIISTVELINSPSEFNNEDSFAVQIKGKAVPQDINRKNRLWFDIERNKEVFTRSNWLEIGSDDTTEKTLEWGDAWLYSYTNFKIIPNMITHSNNLVENIVFGNSNPITIYRFDGSIVVKSVEYDEQQDQTVYSTANLGAYNDGGKAIDQAFNPAGVAINFDNAIDQDTLRQELIKKSQVDLIDFISSNKNLYRDIYLAGIKGFYTGEDSTVIDYSILGVTVFDYSNNPIGILISHDANIYFVNSYLSSIENRFISYSKSLQSSIIHELGHFLGKINHPKEHTCLFCIMYSYMIGSEFYYDNMNFDSILKSTYINPHFCSDCLNELKNNT